MRPESSCKMVEVSFNNGSRKDYFRNTTSHFFEKGDMIAVEGVSGFDVGSINMTGELVRLQLKKNNIKQRGSNQPAVRREPNYLTRKNLNILLTNSWKIIIPLFRYFFKLSEYKFHSNQYSYGMKTFHQCLCQYYFSGAAHKNNMCFS